MAIFVKSTDATEETPLLQDVGTHTTHDQVFERFSSRWKRLIVAMVSFCGILPLFISGTFIPCIPQISKDMGTTGSVVSLAVSASISGGSIGALTSSTYSTFYGRRPIYLMFLPLLAAGSFGVASTRSVTQLMAWRVLQAFGASPGLSVGAGVIGDIYRLEERGGAMGIFFASILLGPMLAPFIGGFAAHYSSWRALQVYIGVAALLTFFIVFAFFPETSHPGERGVDKLRHEAHPRWRPVILNPLRPLGLLRSPNLLFVCFTGFVTLLTNFVLLVPIVYTIGKKYNITNEAIIGACFLPAGMGNLIAAPLAGRISDMIVVRYRARRGGVWYPEDRIRGTLFGALIIVPVSIIGSGIVTTYVEDRKVGLALNLICLFLNGFGVDVVLSPCAAYIVDVMHSRSAEIMAANNASRSLLLAIFIAGIIPMIEKYGVLVTNTISGASSLIGFGLLWATISYGEQLRNWEWGNVGYSDEGDNREFVSTHIPEE